MAKTEAPTINQQSNKVARLSERSLVAGRSMKGAMQMASTLSRQKMVAATRMSLAIWS
jgi:hypothetical protein